MREARRAHGPAPRRRVTSAVATLAAIACMAAPALGFGSSTFATPAAGAATAGTSSDLHAVSCVNATTCFAVGEYFPAGAPRKTLIERWNGKAWSIVASPNPANKLARLFAVSCTNATSCFAVGLQFDTASSTGKTLVERWNGKSWSIVASPNPKGTAHDTYYLYGVSCTSATFCVAAGQQFGADSTGNFTSSKAIIEQWNGHAWTLATSPAPKGAVSWELKAVTCTSTLGCFAVGDLTPKTRPPNTFSDGPLTLIERWNGKTWSVLPTPSPDIGSGSVLLSVSCTNATSCMAAGEYAIGGPGRSAALSLRWNGKTWTLLTTPAPSRSYSWFGGVSCPSATTCLAVGYYSQFNAKGSKALFEGWNGKAWGVLSGPPTSNTSLEAVSCTSSSNCYAVGQKFATATGISTTLVYHYNGALWSVVTSPSA